MQVAKSMAAVAATISRLEPQVRNILDATLTAPAPFAAAAALLTDVDGASRFDARVFTVVSGCRYRAITNGCAQFTLKPDQAPLPGDELDRLAYQAGQSWRPPTAAAELDPAYWAVDLELRCRTHAALRNADLGQSTWQGAPGTQTWAEPSTGRPAHILVQDTFGGVAQPGRSGSWSSPAPRTLVVVGARYGAALAAAALAEALGWQFVPVRSDLEVTADDRFVPVEPERATGRVLAWTAAAQHIAQRHRAGDPWPAVVLLRPSALSGRTETDQYAIELLRSTPASVVYVRPTPASLAWWVARQVSTALPGQFDSDRWVTHTHAELRAIERVLATRDQSRDLYLAPSDVEVPTVPAAEIPEQVMDAEARIAWTMLDWLDLTVNRSNRSLLTQLQPGTLANWLPTLAADPAAAIPRLTLA